MLERDKDPTTDYSAWYGHNYAGREDRPFEIDWRRSLLRIDDTGRQHRRDERAD